jgi:hypothetical protein
MVTAGFRPRPSISTCSGHPLPKQRAAMVGQLVIYPSDVISKDTARETTEPHHPDLTTAVDSRRRARIRRLILPTIGTGKTLKLRFVIARSEFASNTIQATGERS